VKTEYEWWRQSTYCRVSIEWAHGFAQWLRNQGWQVGLLVDDGNGTIHVPAIRPRGER
jgi:hypothetical protein